MGTMYIAIRRCAVEDRVIGMSRTLEGMQTVVEEYTKTILDDIMVDIHNYIVDKVYDQKYIGTYYSATKTFIFSKNYKANGYEEKEPDVLEEFCLLAIHGDPVACDAIRDILRI